ncbi:MAG TPA: hypothetical protein VJW55_10075 [Candidatus Angelobacter sp.]|nr:hypothetical protein [Candidatus Angelobacter sp.]
MRSYLPRGVIAPHRRSDEFMSPETAHPNAGPFAAAVRAELSLESLPE